MPELLGADGFAPVADAALELSGVDGVEVLFMHEWGGLTRFAKSEIHQSTNREDTGLRVRVVSKGRVGVAATNECTPEGARKAAQSAKEMAEIVGPDPLWPGLGPVAPTPQVDRFFEGTANASPEMRAEAVADLIGTCAPGFTAAGAYETMAMEVGLANTEGQRCWAPSTQASVTTVMSGSEGGSGFAETFSGSVETIDAGAIGRRANDKALGSRSPKALDAGVYPVVLEPAAVATLIGFLAWVGFGGKGYLEDRSCFSGKKDQQVAAPTVSIWDDGTDPRTLGAPFDFEGVPKRRVDLIRDGVFLDAVYDLRTGKEAGVPSTGHGLPSPNPEGPFPLQPVHGHRGRHRRGHGEGHGTRRAGDPVPLRQHREPDREFDHRHDPRRHVPDRARRGRRAGAELPVHAVDPRRAVHHVDGGPSGRAGERVLLQRLTRARAQGGGVQLLRRQRPLGPHTADAGRTLAT